MRTAGLLKDDTLRVSIVNGAIVLVPTHAARTTPTSMRRFVGAAKGLNGATAEESDALQLATATQAGAACLVSNDRQFLVSAETACVAMMG